MEKPHELLLRNDRPQLEQRHRQLHLHGRHSTDHRRHGLQLLPGLLLQHQSPAVPSRLPLLQQRLLPVLGHLRRPDHVLQRLDRLVPPLLLPLLLLRPRQHQPLPHLRRRNQPLPQRDRMPVQIRVLLNRAQDLPALPSWVPDL